MRHVIHVGPDVDTVGGIQAVLRTIRDNRMGADRITLVSTWGEPSIRHNAVLTAKAAAVIMRAERSAIVHVHLSDRGAYLRDPPLAALARARGLRVVFSLHGHDFPTFASAHPRIVRAALACAQHVICLSDAAAEAAASIVGPERVTQLPNAVTIDRDSPPASETEPVVLFAGVVGLRKGVDVLVEAWRTLLDSNIEGCCRIVGPIRDYQPPELERLTLYGPAGPAEIRDLIRTSRVVVLPSRSEEMPMILAEAIAGGRSFVATPVGGTRMLAPSPEMLVPVGDVKSLAAAIRRYLTDPGYARSMGEQAQRFCIDTRSPELIGARLGEIYDAC